MVGSPLLGAWRRRGAHARVGCVLVPEGSMRPRWASLVVLCGAVAAIGPESVLSVEEPPKMDSWDCGAVALYHLLHLTGRSADLNELRSVTRTPGAEGHSFRELRQAARHFGLPLVAVVLPKRRSAIQGPVLLFVKMGREGHYLVVRPVGHTGHLVQVLDGARPPDVIDVERLFDSPSWTGLALVPRGSNHLAMAAGGLGLACLAAFVSRLWMRAHGKPPIEEQRRETDPVGSGDRPARDRVP